MIKMVLTLNSQMKRILTRNLNVTPSQSQFQSKGRRMLLRFKIKAVNKRASIRFGINRKLLKCGMPIWLSRPINVCNREIKSEVAISKSSDSIYLH